MKIIIAVYAWSAAVTIIILAMRCVHLFWLNRNLLKLTHRQANSISIYQDQVKEAFEIIADQKNEVYKWKKTAFSWEAYCLRVQDMLKKNGIEVPIVNLKTENDGNK